jgi:hypothetical protein
MTENELHPGAEAPTQELPSYNMQIRELIMDAHIPEGVITDRDIRVAAGLLDKSCEQSQDIPGRIANPYHDIQHDFNVLRRSWTLWGEFQKRLPQSFGGSGYRTLLLGALGHDRYVHRHSEEGKDEKRSGKHAMRYMISNGYSQEESREVYEIIQGTAVRRSESGSIIQYKLTDGVRSPEKFTLGIADTYGILIEGTPTLVEDVLNLHMEFSQTSMKDLLHNPKKALGLMMAQDEFIQDRLDCLKEATDYNFKTKEERKAVEEVLMEQFSSGGSEALALAKKMKTAPKLAETVIRNALRATSHGSNKVSSLHDKLGSIIPGYKNDD